MKAVIFAGGVGSRLWPLSRKNTPKQFEKIVGDKSTLQLAAERVLEVASWSDIFISTGFRYKDIIKSQLPELPEKNILVEPEMRDVGPAIGYVISILAKIDEQEPVALFWSDHLIKKEEVFTQAILTAQDLIKENPDKIVFIGQTPRFASQNLGYIEFGEEVFPRNNFSIKEFRGFKYKPSLEVAESFLADQHHCWNLGYFVTTPKFLWSLFQKHSPELYEKLKLIQDAYGQDNFEQVLNEVYPTVEKVHFDNAILEKIDKEDALVLSADLGWSDVGAWEALKEAITDTEEENATKGEVVLEDSRDSLVFNYSDKLIVGIDLDQMLVVDAEDVLLVCPKNSVPKLKKLLEKLANSEYEKLT
jgi:mannose-1-phosphate guanylyltransferase